MADSTDWESNALLSEIDKVVPCNIQDAGEESDDAESMRYFWALPLERLPNRPMTSLLAEWNGNSIDPITNLPVVSWCELQPCLCNDGGDLQNASFAFIDDESDAASADNEENEPYQLMVSLEKREGVMLGTWDGRNRDAETGLPVVELVVFRA